MGVLGAEMIKKRIKDIFEEGTYVMRIFISVLPLMILG
jgi:hypothetical protein